MSLEVIKVLEVNDLKIVSQLTTVESNLLNVLAQRGNRVVSKRQIEDVIYAAGTMPASNCIEVFVGRLRRKLNKPEAVKTVRGRGYMLVVPKEIIAETPAVLPEAVGSVELACAPCIGVIQEAV